MKTIVINITMVLVVIVLTSQMTQAQGTITYLSNLGQTSTGNDVVGSDSWLATGFQTGSNVGGYLLNSIQLAMTDASGSPSGFTIMLYANKGPLGFSPGSSLDTLSDSTDPSTAGIYTYTPVTETTLSAGTIYFIVLTAGTPLANGAYGWGYAGARAYNPIDGWFSLGNIYTSSDGLLWTTTAGNPQYAITAIAIPEPSPVFLFLPGSGVLFYVRRIIHR